MVNNAPAGSQAAVVSRHSSQAAFAIGKKGDRLAGHMPRSPNNNVSRL